MRHCLGGMQAVDWLVFLSAWLGHTSLLVFGINWIHGIGVPHKIQALAKFSLALLILAGLPLFWWTSGFALDGLSELTGGRLALAGYTALCCLHGLVMFVVLPV